MPIRPQDRTQAMPAYDDEILDASRPTAKPPRGIGVSGDSRREATNSPFPLPSKAPEARKASGEMQAVKALVRESVAPKEAWAVALEETAKELRHELSRVSDANLDKFRVVDGELNEHETRVDEHEERLKRIESNSTDAAVSSGAVQKLLSGFLPPKLVMGIAALGAIIQGALQIWQALRGH